MMKNDAALSARIHEWFISHTDAMLSDLCDLVSIRSVEGAPSGEMPYGEGPFNALMCARDILTRLGFKTESFENRVLTADMNEKAPSLGILAHLDVVEEGDGWKTDPFELSISENGDMLYGRGVSDDKGPAIAAIYAMAAARELAPALTKNCRILLGTAEETGMDDLAHYAKANTYPPFVFSPDSDYPLINTEKGRFLPSFSAEWEEDKDALPRILSVTGGAVANIVPHLCSAEVEGLPLALLRDSADAFAEKTGAVFTVSGTDERAEITVTGTASHGSLPENGNNAQTALLSLLASLPFAETRGFEYIRALSSLLPHGDWAGRAIGIAMQDKLSGALTVNFGVFSYSPGKISGTLDIRTPVCADESGLPEAMKTLFEGYGLSLDITAIKPSHHTSPDSPLVKTLLSIYEDVTGEKGECLSVGGLTYAHSIDGAVAFGCRMPGKCCNMHAANECIPLSDLLLSAEMFTRAIIEMCS